MNPRPDPMHPDPSRPDPMWERVVDDHRPRRRELAAAEAQLHTTSAPALAPDTVAAIVARAIAAPVAARTGMPGRRLPKLVAVALMTALCVTSLAWVSAKVVWPEHRASSLTVQYFDAVRDAIAAPSEAGRASAVSIVDDHCLLTCRSLRSLRASEDAAIAALAAAACSELSVQLSAGTATVLRDDVDVHAQMRTAENVSLDTTARTAAVTELVRATAPGLVAMRLARLDAQNARYRADMVARLERTLK